MKILINNSEMIFRKTEVVNTSYTKEFNQSEVGRNGMVILELPSIVKPGTPVEITVTGDSGVVENNIWSLLINGKQSSGHTITTNGEKLTFTYDGVLTKLWLQRDSIAAAGSITLHAKYAVDRQYSPTELINQDITISNENPETIITLDSPIVAPAFVQARADGTAGAYIKFTFLDSNDTEVTTAIQETNVGYYGKSVSSNVAKVKVGRNTGSSMTGTFAVQVIKA